MPVYLYHGTKVSNLSSISLTGLRESTGGRLGSGLYLTDEQNATKIALYRKNNQNGTGSLIIKVQVDLGKMKIINNQTNDTKGSWHSLYDSCRGIHPPWGNCSAFTEYCIKNANKCKIVEVTCIGGTVKGDVSLPGVNIRCKGGNITFNGNITCGTLIIG